MTSLEMVEILKKTTLERYKNCMPFTFESTKGTGCLHCSLIDAVCVDDHEM